MEANYAGGPQCCCTSKQILEPIHLQKNTAKQPAWIFTTVQSSNPVKTHWNYHLLATGILKSADLSSFANLKHLGTIFVNPQVGWQRCFLPDDLWSFENQMVWNLACEIQ